MSFRTPIAVGTLAWSLCILAQTPAPPPAAARLTPNDLKADVSFLASDALQGRGTPSPGLDVAAEYVAAQFRRAGLEPAGDDGYFQTAVYLSVQPNSEGLELVLETANGPIHAGKEALAIVEPGAVDLNRAAAFKAPSDPTALGALTPERVRGKILILDPSPANGPRRLSAALARLEPALVVLVRSGRPPSDSGRQLRERSAAASVPVLAVWDEAIRRALDAAPAGPLAASVSAREAAPAAAPVKLRNVIGVLRGSDKDLRDAFIFLTAHYDHLGVMGSGPGDHIYNGANDDASGTASVIEIAGALASAPERPRRSIVFMTFFGEELGLLGSRYYVGHPVFPLAKTVADLNLEQMGRTDDETGPRVGLINVTGYDFTSITGVLREAGKETGIGVVKDEEASDPFYARGDNQAFADAGVPAHTLSVGYTFPDYHQPGDEWPKLDYENMARVDRAIALAVWRIADSSTVPAWNAANSKTERYVRARGNSAAPGAGSR
jgi:hypothetical protein